MDHPLMYMYGTMVHAHIVQFTCVFVTFYLIILLDLDIRTKTILMQKLFSIRLNITDITDICRSLFVNENILYLPCTNNTFMYLPSLKIFVIYLFYLCVLLEQKIHLVFFKATRLGKWVILCRGQQRKSTTSQEDVLLAGTWKLISFVFPLINFWSSLRNTHDIFIAITCIFNSNENSICYNTGIAISLLYEITFSQGLLTPVLVMGHQELFSMVDVPGWWEDDHNIFLLKYTCSTYVQFLYIWQWDFFFFRKEEGLIFWRICGF